jgi:hypothetical protein
MAFLPFFVPRVHLFAKQLSCHRAFGWLLDVQHDDNSWLNIMLQHSHIQYYAEKRLRGAGLANCRIGKKPAVLAGKG